jgi:hypothetical protein
MQRTDALQPHPPGCSAPHRQRHAACAGDLHAALQDDDWVAGSARLGYPSVRCKRSAQHLEQARQEGGGRRNGQTMAFVAGAAATSAHDACTGLAQRSRDAFCTDEPMRPVRQAPALKCTQHPSDGQHSCGSEAGCAKVARLDWHAPHDGVVQQRQRAYGEPAAHADRLRTINSCSGVPHAAAQFAVVAALRGGARAARREIRAAPAGTLPHIAQLLVQLDSRPPRDAAARAGVHPHAAHRPVPGSPASARPMHSCARPADAPAATTLRSDAAMHTAERSLAPAAMQMDTAARAAGGQRSPAGMPARPLQAAATAVEAAQLCHGQSRAPERAPAQKRRRSFFGDGEGLAGCVGDAREAALGLHAAVRNPQQGSTALGATSASAGAAECAQACRQAAAGLAKADVVDLLESETDQDTPVQSAIAASLALNARTQRIGDGRAAAPPPGRATEAHTASVDDQLLSATRRQSGCMAAPPPRPPARAPCGHGASPRAQPAPAAQPAQRVLPQQLLSEAEHVLRQRGPEGAEMLRTITEVVRLGAEQEQRRWSGEYASPMPPRPAVSSSRAVEPLLAAADAGLQPLAPEAALERAGVARPGEVAAAMSHWAELVLQMHPMPALPKLATLDPAPPRCKGLGPGRQAWRSAQTPSGPPVARLAAEGHRPHMAAPRVHRPPSGAAVPSDMRALDPGDVTQDALADLLEGSPAQAPQDTLAALLERSPARQALRMSSSGVKQLPSHMGSGSARAPECASGGVGGGALRSPSPERPSSARPAQGALQPQDVDRTTLAALLAGESPGDAQMLREQSALLPAPSGSAGA